MCVGSAVIDTTFITRTWRESPRSNQDLQAVPVSVGV